MGCEVPLLWNNGGSREEIANEVTRDLGLDDEQRAIQRTGRRLFPEGPGNAIALKTE